MMQMMPRMITRFPSRRAPPRAWTASTGGAIRERGVPTRERSRTPMCHLQSWRNRARRGTAAFDAWASTVGVRRAHRPGAAAIAAAVAGISPGDCRLIRRCQRAGSAVRAQRRQLRAISSSPVAEMGFQRLPNAARWTNGEVEARLIEPRPTAVLSESGSVVVGFEGPGLDSMSLDKETGHHVFSRVVLEVGLRGDLATVTVSLTGSGYRVDEIRRVAGAGLSGHFVTALRLGAMCASLPPLAARRRFDKATPAHPVDSSALVWIEVEHPKIPGGGPGRPLNPERVQLAAKTWHDARSDGRGVQRSIAEQLNVSISRPRATSGQPERRVSSRRTTDM